MARCCEGGSGAAAMAGECCAVRCSRGHVRGGCWTHRSHFFLFNFLIFFILPQPCSTRQHRRKPLRSRTRVWFLFWFWIRSTASFAAPAVACGWPTARIQPQPSPNPPTLSRRHRLPQRHPCRTHPSTPSPPPPPGRSRLRRRHSATAAKTSGRPAPALVSTGIAGSVCARRACVCPLAAYASNPHLGTHSHTYILHMHVESRYVCKPEQATTAGLITRTAAYVHM